MKTTLYVFPKESIQSIKDKDLVEKLKFKRAITGKVMVCPEYWMTMKQKHMFNPNKYKEFEAIITTDYLLPSAFQGEDVLICTYGRYLTIKNAPQTFGCSYDYLLGHLFKLKSLVSNEALKYMRKAVKGKTMEDMRKAIYHLGESFEKRFIYERAYKIEDAKKKQTIGE